MFASDFMQSINGIIYDSQSFKVHLLKKIAETAKQCDFFSANIHLLLKFNVHSQICRGLLDFFFRNF